MFLPKIIFQGFETLIYHESCLCQTPLDRFVYSFNVLFVIFTQSYLLSIISTGLHLTSIINNTIMLYNTLPSNNTYLYFQLLGQNCLAQFYLIVSYFCFLSVSFLLFFPLVLCGTETKATSSMADSVTPRLYSCYKCHNLISRHDDIVSKDFQVNP